MRKGAVSGRDDTIAAMSAELPETRLQRALERLRPAVAGVAGDHDAALRSLAIASDFAVEVLAARPELLRQWVQSAPDPLPIPVLDPQHRSDWPRALRQYRKAESSRLIWRDAQGLDDVDATLAGTTRLAETCLRLALEALEADFAQRHGVVRDAQGNAQRLVVFGLGKLGGGELNFSSDIDLVYAYEHEGESDGGRPLAASDYFARLGQQLAKLLDEVTADGFSHRVDLRLRPFGSAGRVALSFAAMEQYFQREGRDWERYAWQKARPVAGDVEAGERFLCTLRPFVYRRYLDFGALDGLRTMKAAIAAEVARKELADDIKRGPGGIREIEFLAQALQLIRGGREPALQERRLQPALHALMGARQIEPGVGAALLEAYRFLRRLENRLQMLRDAQTHLLPADESDQARVAAGLGFDSWQALRAQLDAHRQRVATEFAALLAPRGRQREPAALAAYWHALPEGGEAGALAAAGFAQTAALDAALRDFVRVPGVRELSDASRARLDRVMPALLQAAADSSQPDAALRRVLALLHNILRRGSYLALLDEQPAALSRLVDAVARSALLAERIAAHPLLLDELLDARHSGDMPDRNTLQAECEQAVSALGGDVEATLQALNERRQALGFRIGLAALDNRQPAADSARQLAWLADAVVAIVLRLAQAEVAHHHGTIEGARFAVLGYGSLGGEELGFGSDLDLVFLYDAPADAESKPAPGQAGGARSLDAQRWHARLAQKVVALLGSETGAGKLYEVDVRLRPDGAKGLLVSSLDSYADYQRARAWTWEHQALVRARCVAGDADLCAQFERVRDAVLSQRRDPADVRKDVSDMRRRMRAELDRSQPPLFDLKQGEGGLVDLEFLLQAQVLQASAQHADLLRPRATPGLLDAIGVAGLLSADEVGALCGAHAVLVDAGLRCTLDRRSRLMEETTEIARARGTVSAAADALGLSFGSAA
jgi:glutamate-ammonia-ligase adenylyltransferase